MIKRFIIWIKVLYYFLSSFRGSKANILDAGETVEEILNGRSLIRFGDGEFGIYRGDRIHYQKWSEELRGKFEQIKNTYLGSPEDCPYLLAVPRVFMKCSGFRLAQKRVYVSSWARSRVDFSRFFPQNIPYGDAFLFEKANKTLYEKIWIALKKSGKRVIFIHRDRKYAESFKETYRLPVFYYQCPANDAFEKLGVIEKEIDGLIKKNDLNANDTVFLISMGPAGKALAFDYCGKGFQCIDTGHCWDDPLEGLTERK